MPRRARHIIDSLTASDGLCEAENYPGLVTSLNPGRHGHSHVWLSSAVRFSTRTEEAHFKVYVGDVDDDGEVRGMPTRMGQHSSMGLNNTPWRYNTTTETVYWWKLPRAIKKDCVVAWLERRGMTVRKHKKIGTNSFDAAHGISDNDTGGLDEAADYYIDAP